MHTRQHTIGYVLATTALVFGAGCAGGGSSLPQLSSAQPLTQTLTPLATQPVSRKGAATGDGYVSNGTDRLFVAAGANVGIYDQGQKNRQISVPKGSVVRGGLHERPNGTLYAVAGYVDKQGGNDSATAYAFNAPYSTPEWIGITQTVLINNPVDICAPTNGEFYVVNQGMGIPYEKKVGYDVDSMLFTDSGGSRWSSQMLPTREQFDWISGSGEDQYGDCFFPGASGVEEYTGSNSPVHVLKYRGNPISSRDLAHRAVAVSSTKLFVSDSREIHVYDIAGYGALPGFAYDIPRPWAEGSVHVGGAFARFGADEHDVLYSARAEKSMCGVIVCYYDKAVDEYGPEQTKPVRSIKLPGDCKANFNQCLVDMTVSRSGYLFIEIGNSTIYEYAPATTAPLHVINVQGLITSLYAP